MKNTILIVDDQEINRVLLAEQFKDEYNIIEAENGAQALKIINENKDLVAIMLDLIMPMLDGMGVLAELNRSGKIYHIPVFVITAADNMEILSSAYSLGAVDIISKPFQMVFIKSRINNIIELFRHRNELVDVVEESVEKITRINSRMIDALAALIEFRECESGVHVKRMRAVTERLMTALGILYPEYGVDRVTVSKIGEASILHDIGKIVITDSVLKKTDKLTPEEFEVIKSHTVGGCDILEQMYRDIMDSETYRFCCDICRYHHERWDGGGYPDGLVGDEIPIWAQAVGIADAFDALTSPRVYRPAFDFDTAVKMINDGECGAFNPKLLQAWNTLIKSGERFSDK